MKERPITFSGWMVRAILDGRKTQTRRVIKHRHAYKTFNAGPDGGVVLDAPARIPDDELDDACEWLRAHCPHGTPGDRLLVREVWAAPHAHDHLPPKLIPRDARIHYAASEDRGGLRWRSPIHMPRWASRITLEVTGVRVERLQEISEADAIAEGLYAQDGDGYGPGPGYKWIGRGYHGAGFDRWKQPTFHTPRNRTNGRCACRANGDTPAQCAYRELWDSMNAKRAPWSSNPWIWVIEFKRAE